jgi:pyrroloquinoline quinone (PQQ) biosynthesis protein C
MAAFDDLRVTWREVEHRFMSSRPMARLLEGKVTSDHYAAYLRETYFYTRESPQIQAVATAWFRGSDRQMVKPFLRHALSEVGRDALALGDLENLGRKIESLPDEKPLPSTAGLISFPYYSIQYRSPLSYLGYLYFLEFLPTARGGEIAGALAKVGVPQTAMTFLAEHRTVDIHHNRLMEHYAEYMLRSSSDIGEVAYCMTVTGDLYARMVEGAFQSADDAQIGSPGLHVA